MPYIPPSLPFSTNFGNYGYPRYNFRSGLTNNQRDRILASRARASRIRGVRRRSAARTILKAFRRRK